MIHVINTAVGQLTYAFFKQESNQTKRAFEKEIVNLLLGTLSVDPVHLSYGEKGNPILLNSTEFISISHSNGHFAVYHSTTPVGIDIQTFKKRISAGTYFFLTDTEKKWTDSDDLHLIWCAKEAIFKKMHGEFSNYLMDICVLDIRKETNQLLVRYFEKEEILHFQINNGIFLVYTIE